MLFNFEKDHHLYHCKIKQETINAATQNENHVSKSPS